MCQCTTPKRKHRDRAHIYAQKERWKLLNLKYGACCICICAWRCDLPTLTLFFCIYTGLMAMHCTAVVSVSPHRSLCTYYNLMKRNLIRILSCAHATVRVHLLCIAGDLCAAMRFIKWIRQMLILYSMETQRVCRAVNCLIISVCASEWTEREKQLGSLTYL